MFLKGLPQSSAQKGVKLAVKVSDRMACGVNH